MQEVIQDRAMTTIFETCESREEAYYWFSKVADAGKGRRSPEALRILLAKEMATAKSRQHADVWQQLEWAAETFSRAGDLDYMLLSVAAKTYFMLGEKKGAATEPELAALAPRFGWNVTAKEIRQAAGYLDKLGVVQVAGN